MTELRDFIVAGRVVRLLTINPNEHEFCDVDLSEIVAVVYREPSDGAPGACLFTAEGFLLRVVDDDTFRAAWKRECDLRAGVRGGLCDAAASLSGVAYKEFVDHGR